MNRKIIYYSDEKTDEFSTAQIVPIKIDQEYRYMRKGWFHRLKHIFWYHLIATPLAFLYLKIYFGHKIINRKILKKENHSGYFLYGNHTHFLADALIPTMISFPKDISVIVHPNNVSMPVLGKITPYLGALPLPDDSKAAKNFIHKIESLIKENKSIMIYPEAHIWPYYTDIRDFPDSSFRYPVSYKMPVYCLTNTYQKRKIGKRPRIITYIDGPFYVQDGLSIKEQRKELRDAVYNTMKQRAQMSNIELIVYKKKA